MKVNFQIVHDSEDIDSFLFLAMKEAYENLYIEREEDELKSFYKIRYNFHLRNSKSIAGFEIEIEEISPEDYDAFLNKFTGKIKDDQHIFALIKFQDETRFESYLNFYREIAALEMQLREILSFIFYYEYSEDLYNLVEEYEVNFPKDTPEQEELQKRLENQFFYLTFSNYLNLDKPKEIRHVKDINAILKSSDSYEDFKEKICNRGIKNEKNLDFLAAIKQNLQTIESVRNAVAHNRTISSAKLGHYETAKRHLTERLQEFWGETAEER